MQTRGPEFRLPAPRSKPGKAAWAHNPGVGRQTGKRLELSSQRIGELQVQRDTKEIRWHVTEEDTRLWPQKLADTHSWTQPSVITPHRTRQSQEQRHTFVVPPTQEAEAEGSFEPRK